MKIILIYIWLVGGEIVRVPTLLNEDQNCLDRLLELTTQNKNNNRILFKNKVVKAYYCQPIIGEKYYDK